MCLVIAVLSLLTASFVPSHSANAESEALKELSIGVVWRPGQAGVFVAEEKGYFEEAGLTTGMIEFPDPQGKIVLMHAGCLYLALSVTQA